MRLSTIEWTLLLLLAAVKLVASQALPQLTPRQLAVNQLVNASRILAQQTIADDSPGHISIRDPLAPNLAFLITAGTHPAAQITPADIAVARINDSIVTSAALSGYPAPARPAEIFLHSSIYQRFPNTTVASIAFYRPEQLLPYTMFPDKSSNASAADATVSDMTSLYAATSGAAFMGGYAAPVFDAFDAEPATITPSVDNVVKGFALAQKFGPANARAGSVNETDGFRPLVLMRNDGATVVGTSVPETVFRFVNAVKSARVQWQASAMAFGNGSRPLFLPNAAAKANDAYLRSWLLWMTQIEDSIRADEARSPELWETDDANSTTGDGGGSLASGAVATLLARPQTVPIATAAILLATLL
ncbi:Class II aldolase/adducin N-terminal [Kalmanozyma brasiliensis GHG001]|uniref:Class II aldolase/adducin N-terminal domain-containing protein n=1 Tax=Kalmanozyma brasiliensis (strain GHG001) TaxID=1365824 RepID=V5EPG4_KALBG|nr:Class II aldolase/adducin N-terminal [Kalmanozyma brasiliensis GHG001]EST07000.1 Class II aldolase/adducin N-terminal [Kalmanozyma brasiliensis GHG001]